MKFYFYAINNLKRKKVIRKGPETKEFKYSETKGA